ncbi:MAG: DUF992 domain-containing protein [Pseudomonadota bacterium]
MISRLFSRICLTVVFIAAFCGLSIAQERVELGKLECFVDAGTGFILGSTKDISCVFTPVNAPDTEDNYFGVINKFGLDIGSTEQAFMTWLVIAPTTGDQGPGFLAGDYVGATASATVAVGLGANVLVGGSKKSFALQPLSLETQTGLNLAAGIAEIELRSVE